MKLKARNVCTNEVVEIDWTETAKTLKIKVVDNLLDNFLPFNYKKFTFGCSSSYFYEYEFLNNEIEVNIGNITVLYDITKLDSNIANNCADGVQMYLNDTQVKFDSKYINSKLFKYFEIRLYNDLHDFLNKLARMCTDYEQGLDEEDIEFFNNDTIEDIYNVLVSDYGRC